MKVVLAQRSRQKAHRTTVSGNEVLRLAAEIHAEDGRLPKIDVARTQLDHWNGAKIAIARSDLDELIARGLIDRTGKWTDQGRRALERQAGEKVPDPSDRRSRSFI